MKTRHTLAQRKEAGRLHARGWHADMLEIKAKHQGRTMADVWCDGEPRSAYTIPAEYVRTVGVNEEWRFKDGSTVWAPRPELVKE